jgi:hypothetical protein
MQIEVRLPKIEGLEFQCYYDRSGYRVWGCLAGQCECKKRGYINVLDRWVCKGCGKWHAWLREYEACAKEGA